jgi:glycosyltransferase involved in cell wall biosynthesis
LQRCITSIEKAHEYQPGIAVELLVAIQQAKQKKELCLRHPGITTVYYIDKLGLSVARNYAIARSAGDYLVFLDDDAAVKEDFIAVLSETALAYGRVGAFCGRIIDPVKQAPFSPLFSNDQKKYLRRMDFQNFMGSAHVLSRRALDRVGGYDERFGVGAKYYGSEETDMFFKLVEAREQVMYVPELVFYHPIPVTPAKYVYKYAYAIGAVLAKHCLADKAHALSYGAIAVKRMIKALARIGQKNILKGRYLEKDALYHYGSVVRGTIDGFRSFIVQEHLSGRKVPQ